MLASIGRLTLSSSRTAWERWRLADAYFPDGAALARERSALPGSRILLLYFVLALGRSRNRVETFQPSDSWPYGHLNH